MKNISIISFLLLFSFSVSAVEICFTEIHDFRRNIVYYDHDRSSNFNSNYRCPSNLDCFEVRGEQFLQGLSYNLEDIMDSSKWSINDSNLRRFSRSQIVKQEYDIYDEERFDSRLSLPAAEDSEIKACIDGESYLKDGRNDFSYTNDVFNQRIGNTFREMPCTTDSDESCPTVRRYILKASLEVEGEGRFLLCDIDERSNFPIRKDCDTFVDIDLIDEVELLEGITQFESTIADFISDFDADIATSQATIDKALALNNEIFDLDFSELSASDLTTIKEAQDFFNDLKDKATDVQKEIESIASEIERKIDDTAIDVDTRLAERGFTPAGIQFESTLPDYSLDIPSTSTSDRFAESGSFYEDYADDSIKTLARYYNAGDNRQFLIEVRAWLNNSETLKRNLSVASFDSPAEWRKFSDAFKRVNDYIYSIVDSELWFKDSPVSPYIRESFNDLAKDFPIQAQAIEDEMRTWRGQVVTEQQLAFIRAFEGIARGFRAMGSELALIGKAATDIMNSAASSVKSGVTCATKVVALADMGDMIELTSGRDICTGEELTATGRFLTGIGLGIGYGKFWRAVGETLGLNIKVKATTQDLSLNIDLAKNLSLNEADINRIIEEITKNTSCIK